MWRLGGSARVQHEVEDRLRDIIEDSQKHPRRNCRSHQACEAPDQKQLVAVNSDLFRISVPCSCS